MDQATDGQSATAQLNITVLDYNDNTPQFPSIPDPLDVPEGDYTEENPYELTRIVPTDADLGPNGEVTISLASPQPLFKFREVRQRENVETCFSLCRVSRTALSLPAVLQDGMLLAVGELDRETRETYDLVVKASDKGSPQREVRNTCSKETDIKHRSLFLSINCFFLLFLFFF